MSVDHRSITVPAGGREVCGQGFGEPLSFGKVGLAPGGLRSFLLAGFVTSFHLWDAGPTPCPYLPPPLVSSET